MNKTEFRKAVKLVKKSNKYYPKDWAMRNVFGLSARINYYDSKYIPHLAVASKEDQLAVLYYYAYWYPLVKDNLKATKEKSK